MNSEGPDFVGVGFPKCGTTFLYDEVICQHRDVLHLPKERHFFSQPFHKFNSTEKENYLNNFPDTNKVTGEFSPGVLYYPMNIKYLYDAVPDDTKFIVLMRNPVDRAFSHMKQMLGPRINNVNPSNKDLFVESSLYPEAIYSGLYYRSLERLFEYANFGEVILLQYEKLVSDFSSEVEELFSFLGLNFEESMLDQINIEKSSKYDNDFRGELAEFYQNDVNQLFSEYDKINQYSEIEIWNEFN